MSSRRDAPQKSDRPHTRAGVADADGGFEGLLSQLSVRTEDWDGDTREQLNRRTMVLDVVSCSRDLRRAHLSYSRGRWKVKCREDEPRHHEMLMNY